MLAGWRGGIGMQIVALYWLHMRTISWRYLELESPTFISKLYVWVICFSSIAVSALPLTGSWSGKARMLWGYVDSRETLPTSPRLQLPTVCTVSCSRGSLDSAGQQLPPVSVIARVEWRDVPADPCTAHTSARWFGEFAGFVKQSRTVNTTDERLGLCNSISNRGFCCKHFL